MFKSITKKLLFTYMAISIISLLLTAAGVSYFIKQEIYGQRKQFLEQKALQVNGLFSLLIEDKISTDYFASMLDMIQNEDKIGISLIIDDNHKFKEKDYFIEYFELEKEKRDIQMMTVSIPLRYDNEVVGEVLINSPVANVELITSNVNKSIFLVFITISIPMALLIFYISRRFTKPLVHMNKIASNISKGNFSETVMIRGNDEVAELGYTLNHMAYKIQKLEELRKDSIANVSHELKTPLTTIQNFIQGILDGVVPENQVESFMKIALDESKRLGKIVDELILLSSYEKKLVKLNLTSNNIKDLIEDILLQMDFNLREKKIHVEKTLDSTINADVDVERFRQVMINILDNAVKHMSQDSKIKITLEKSIEKNFVLTVLDSGPGIEEKHLPYIFERFYKADRSRKKSSGAGLGLTISKHIVEAHGGDINIRNGKEKGLCVEVII